MGNRRQGTYGQTFKDQSEFDAVIVTTEEARRISDGYTLPLRNAPVRIQLRLPFVPSLQFECKYYTTLRLPGNLPMGSVDLVIGQVVGIHIDSSILTGSSPTTSVSGGPRAVVENPKPAPLPQGIAGLIE